MNDLANVPRCGVVLLAAGRGDRLGGQLPKQFLPLDSKPVFAHSLEIFQNLPFVTSMVIVLPQSSIPSDAENYLTRISDKLLRTAGGKRRQDSVAAGLAKLPHDFEVALVHDTARPFPDPRAIATLAVAARKHGGGLLAQRIADTVKEGNATDHVTATLDRGKLWLAQTPQAIRAEFVPRAIQDLSRPDLNVTDEAMLLESWGVPVQLVESDVRNFKITFPSDLQYAKALRLSADGL